MKILHTSDWHLGQNFKNRSREEEHQKFLSWLLDAITQNEIDILVVAGDIFDTTNPPKYALTMYHDFLIDVIKTNCNDIVIVAGNHDSVSTIEMTKNLAKSLNIHIVASGEDIDETIISIKKDEKLQAIVCAVPFLRDRTLRDANTTKNNKEMEDEFKEGIKCYYENIYKKAKRISDDVPIITTGHFTTTGAMINPDSEREIYIGKLADVDSEVLSPFDYVCMGHLHRYQKVGKHNHIRYSGSPIPLSFSEHNQTKKVIVIEFDASNITEIEILDIPLFRGVYRVEGSLEDVKTKIQTIKDTTNRPFLDVVLCDDSILNIDINEFLKTSYDEGVDIISMRKQHKIEDKVLVDVDEDIKLSQLDELSVFEKRLDLEEHLQNDAELKDKLITEYKLILEELHNEDN